MVRRSRFNRRPRASRPRVAQRPARIRRARMRNRVVSSSGPLSDPRVRAWDQLLRDPCAGNLAYPCYSGIDSGYLVRTTDYTTPQYVSALAAGTIVRSDAYFQYSPFNWSGSTGGISAVGVSSAPLPNATNFGYSNNFICTSTVARYRPVAACVKWLPSGPYTSRQGIVSSGVQPGNSIASLSTVTVTAARALCQRFSPNGSEQHEVRWLPTAVDENFTTTTASVNSGAASMLFVLAGVDGTADGTNVTFNGSFEVTIVWEWTPASTTSSGLSTTVKSPNPFTSQQVMSTISDMGAYVFEGLRTVAAQNPGLMSAGVTAAAGVLSGGVGLRGTRGPAMRIRA